MDKPLIKHGKFELHQLREADVLPFYLNLSSENVREFDVLYQRDPYSALLEEAGQDMTHAVKIEDKAIAVTGVYQGVLWAMFSKDIKKNWRGLVRGSPKLISFYHQFFDKLECHIWVENEFTMNWLGHLGFEAKSIDLDDNDNPIVHFVRCNFKRNHVGSKPSRPVMH